MSTFMFYWVKITPKALLSSFSSAQEVGSKINLTRAHMYLVWTPHVSIWQDFFRYTVLFSNTPNEKGISGKSFPQCSTNPHHSQPAQETSQPSPPPKLLIWKHACPSPVLQHDTGHWTRAPVRHAQGPIRSSCPHLWGTTQPGAPRHTCI